MTDTEKILNLLEINEKVPSLVVDENSNVVTSNSVWLELVGKLEAGKKFTNILDKNLSLLVENSLIDAIAFQKIQRREITIRKDDTDVHYNLLMSPFKLNTKTFVYVILYNDNLSEDLFVYPTTDKGEVLLKYDKIIKKFTDTSSMSIIEKKNFQYELDTQLEPLAIIDNKQFTITNKIFNKKFNLSDSVTSPVHAEKLYYNNTLSAVKFAISEIFSVKSSFAIEKVNFIESEKDYGRLFILPIESNISESGKALFVGDLDAKVTNIKTEQNKMEDLNAQALNSKESNELDISNVDSAMLIYDKNNFDILDANKAAADLYQYDLEKLSKMNITQLFLPEDMQTILMPANDNGKHIYQQVRSDGSKIEVNVERKDVTWKNLHAYVETINIIQPEEEVIGLSEFKEEGIHVEDSAADLPIDEEETPKENLSDFLSSLFHELLTPVNVILGFVQEIIDSIDNPTEEQEESAQIIKDNQQILLQSMNTAVQFAQLEENKIDIKSEEFDINNYLVDLEDSFSRIAEDNNVKVNITEIPDSQILNHDRSKLLAAISYFIKFAIKLTETNNIFIAFRAIGNEFHINIKDGEDNSSEQFTRNLLDIYNSDAFNFKKNYGISPITIRLARKLIELLAIRVEEHIDSNNARTISLITDRVFDAHKADLSKKHVIKKVEVIDDTFVEKEEEIIQDKLNLDDSIISSEADNSVNITNGVIDEKIAEDIEEEEEITTEEIATIESKNEEVKNISELSCLFIDDNIDTQLLFKSQMKDFKLLKICSNFTEALPLLTKYNFDLVIVDVNLNDTYNGLDALKITRQFENYKSTPIIAVTAYAFEGDRQKFINFGFTDYITKPIFRDQILKSLEMVIH